MFRFVRLTFQVTQSNQQLIDRAAFYNYTRTITLLKQMIWLIWLIRS